MRSLQPLLGCSSRKWNEGQQIMQQTNKMAAKKRAAVLGNLHNARKCSKRNAIIKALSQLGISWRSGLIFFALPFFISLVFGLFISWPEPDFSESVKNWRDSGFMYKHGDREVFYQDVHQMKLKDRGPPLLLLHGFPSSSYDWKKIIFGLTGHFGRIIAVDMLAFGFSDKPSYHNYTVLEQAKIHENILKNNGIDNVHLLAHDLGDTVAQEMLSRFLERKANNENGLNISSLCLTNGGILPETHRPRFVQKLLRIPVIGSVSALLLNYMAFGRSFSEIFGANSKPSQEELWDFWTIVRHKNGHMAAPRLLNYIDERVESRDRWVGALQTTDVPLHYIYGAQDPVNQEDSIRLYRRLIPHSTVTVLENVGHYPHWEDPDGFLKGYYGFLDRIAVRKK